MTPRDRQSLQRRCMAARRMQRFYRIASAPICSNDASPHAAEPAMAEPSGDAVCFGGGVGHSPSLELARAVERGYARNTDVVS